MKITNITTTVKNVYHGVTVKACEAALPDGKRLEWLTFSEPNQPDFRMMEAEGRWLFPATESQGYFGLSEGAGIMLKAVGKAHRVKRPFIDRGNHYRDLWFVDAVGLAKLVKRAKMDKKGVFVNRVADIILPIIDKTQTEARRQKDERLAFLEAAREKLLDQSVRLQNHISVLEEDLRFKGEQAERAALKANRLAGEIAAIKQTYNKVSGQVTG